MADAGDPQRDSSDLETSLRQHPQAPVNQPAPLPSSFAEARGGFRKVVCFANPASGQRSAFDAIYRGLCEALGTSNVVNLIPRKGVDDPARNGPRAAAEMVRREQLGGEDVVIVAGGDGTVAWGMGIVDGALEGAGPRERPYIGVVPLGTGNDLSRALGFGPGFTEPGCCAAGWLDKLMDLTHRAAYRSALDRWQVDLWAGGAHVDMPAVFPTPAGLTAAGGGGDVRGDYSSRGLVAMDMGHCGVSNNYVSIGFDGSIAKNFDTFRTQYPFMCRNRLGNKAIYGVLGAAALFGAPKISDLCTVSYRASASDPDLRPLDMKGLGLRTLILTNLDSFAAGINPWKGGVAPLRDGLQSVAQSFHDQRIEVCGFTDSQHMGIAKVTPCGASVRLCQAYEVVIDFPPYRDPVNGFSGLRGQVDGEPLRLPASGGRLRLSYLKTARILTSIAAKAGEPRTAAAAERQESYRPPAAGAAAAQPPVAADGAAAGGSFLTADTGGADVAM